MSGSQGQAPPWVRIPLGVRRSPAGSRGSMCTAVRLGAFIGLSVCGAEGAARAGLDLRPSQITVEAEAGSTIRRSVQLRAGEESGPVQAQPMELLSSRGVRVIPLHHIKVTPPDVQDSGSVQTRSFLIEIDLTDAEAGEYAGDLGFTQGRAEVKLPLKIAVRHRWPLPLAVLLLGIGSGLALSAYRAQGRPRDHVLVRIGLLRAFMQRDHALSQGIPLEPPGAIGAIGATGATGTTGTSPATRDAPERGTEAEPRVQTLRNPFLSSLEAILLELEMSLQSERWEDLSTSLSAKMDQAEALLRKWIQGRPGWIDQLAYLGRMLHQQTLHRGSCRYLVTLRGQVADLVASAPQRDSPAVLRDAAAELTDHLERYERAEARLGVLDELRTQLPQGEEAAWIRRSSELRARLEGMRPSEQEATMLLTEIEQAIEALTARLSGAASPDRSVPAGVLHMAASASLATPAPVPTAYLSGSPSGADRAAGAQSRLRWFSYSGYAIALVLLAGAGFNEVYAKKPTFGAELWADYLALLLWGFGAEATRDAVASTLRGWGVAVEGRPAAGK